MTRSGGGPGLSGDPFFGVHLGGGGGLAASYFAGIVNTAVGTQTVIAANNIYAYPFVSPPRECTVDRLSVNITGGANKNARLGLYASLSDTNIYPGVLLVDGGVIATSAGVKHSAVSVDLEPGKLYWASIISDDGPFIRCLQVNGMSAVLGVSDSMSTKQVFLSAALAYGALPANFPAGATVSAGVNIPGIALRFSA